ncbi:MAG: glycoside hydrolase family 78 protein [Acidobacteriia bacterium]|nr:glycoside hydrolase family 78 protein [Terriglobia bacterium]
MSRVRFLLAILPVLSAGLSDGTPLQDWAHSRWKAQWISCPDAPERDAGVFHFRKSVSLPDQPKNFVIHVSADNHFILFVNGSRVGIGPASGDLAHWRYETFDLAPMMHKGENVIAATVWNFGTSTPVAQMSSQTGFVLQGDGEPEQAANTDASWQVEIENGHGILAVNFMALLQSYYAGPPGELIDARKYDWSWNSAQGGAPGTWKKAKLIGPAAARGTTDSPTIWMLIPDALPQMEMTRIPAGHVVSSKGTTPANPQGAFTVAAHSKASVLLDAGALTTAYPELTVSGGSGSHVRVTYAEALVDDHGQKGNRNEVAGRHILGTYDELIADGGHHTFAPLIWRTWRFSQIDVTTGDQAITIQPPAAWFTAYPFHEQAQFAASDPELSKIWEVGWHTARLCAHDTYMDTPYWERLQYVGDTRLQSLISYAVAGDDRLARQAIDTLDDSRIPDGITQSRYPSALPQMISPFALMWVGMVHDFWMHRDDPEFVRRHLAGTRTVLDWFIHYQRSDGLMGLLPWWSFVDWTEDFIDGVPPQEADGGSAPITLQFMEALRNAANLEQQFGDAVRSRMYRERAGKAADGLRRFCWNQQYGLMADTPRQTHYSQHANALAVWLDVVPPEQQKAVMNKVLAGNDGATRPAMSKTSYYFTYYVTRALEHCGLADRYLSTLAPWRKMLALGLSTWAENPEPTRSDSHAWSAHPNYDLLRLVAGIRSAAPGFSEVIIEPHLGTLQSVKASMPHPKGRVDVSFAVSASGTEASIHCPDGVPSKLIWQGKTYPLHAGEQSLRLP